MSTNNGASDKVYAGVDFANRVKRLGRCWVRDDGTNLTVELVSPKRAPVLTGVDCPFGTTAGFGRLLLGHSVPDVFKDGYQARRTERILRGHVGSYRINADWREASAEERGGRDSFFNAGAHVKGAVGLSIVPALLQWLGDQLAAGDDPTRRLALLAQARRGEAPLIEAHPRLFLYSALERLRQSQGRSLSIEDLASIASYKDKGAAGVEGRRRALSLLVSNPEWQGVSPARRLVILDTGPLEAGDHIFDALLAALTAWGHMQGQTWGWTEAGLALETVDVEGHILILRTS